MSQTITLGRILAVENEPCMQEIFRRALGQIGFSVQGVRTGKEALEVAERDPPDLVLLDIQLPEIDGLLVGYELSQISSAPIIFVTSDDRLDTKIAALHLCGDDYITKPFHIDELVARIQAVLRRSHVRSRVSREMEVNSLVLDFDRREVRCEGRPIHLTKIEFALLREFINNDEKVLTFDHLAHAVWRENIDDVHVIHVHVSNLRRKIRAEFDTVSPCRIVAISGVGYRFSQK